MIVLQWLPEPLTIYEHSDGLGLHSHYLPIIKSLQKLGSQKKVKNREYDYFEGLYVHVMLKHNKIFSKLRKKVEPTDTQSQKMPYRTKFRRTKYFVGQNFRHQTKISTILFDFCQTFVLKYWTKFSTDKMFHGTKLLTPS